MSDARTSPDDTAARPATVDPTGRLTASEREAVEAVRAGQTPRRTEDVDGFAMDHERWGTLREGVTGDLYSVISAYKELEEKDTGPSAPTREVTREATRPAVADDDGPLTSDGPGPRSPG